MKTLQVGFKCLHYMFDVNVDKFDSTHIRYMNSLTHKVDLNVYITCTHYKFNSKVFDFYMTRTLTNITAITFIKRHTY